MPPVTASSSPSPDLLHMLHQRRTQLVERETGLQRWAVALELEAARQAEAAGRLATQEGKLSRLAADAAEGKESAQKLLADVAAREQRLQQEAADVEQLHGSVQRERDASAQERAALEAAAAELAQRAANISQREAALSAREEEWAGKVEAANAQFKVRAAGSVVPTIPLFGPRASAGPLPTPSSCRLPARQQPRHRPRRELWKCARHGWLSVRRRWPRSRRA